MHAKMRKGFTLIELMIVIAIIAIIAAIAIPNLLQSRIRANEANAVTQVKNYATAQNIWVNGQQSRVPENGGAKEEAAGGTGGGTPAVAFQGYAFTWPNLFYGTPKSQPAAANDGTYQFDANTNLALISKAHADARLDEFSNINTSGPIKTVGVVSPFQGYLFGNDMADDGWYHYEFSQVGVPTNSRSTGNSAFWVGTQGTVYALGLEPDKGKDDNYSKAKTDSPSVTKSYAGWINM